MAECNCGKMLRNSPLIFIFLAFISISFVSTRSVPGEGDANKRYLLAKDKICANDVAKHCPDVRKENNFETFICLQNTVQKDEDEISEECHELLWHYKYNVTTDPKSHEAAFAFCEKEVETLEECKNPKLQQEKGFLMNCLVENRNEIKDSKCRAFINKMAVVVFSDYRLIKGFYDSCVSDVKTFGCGQLSQPEDKEQHEQADVISCLESRFDEIKNEKCKKAVKRTVEMQSDDYHLDRPLFYACQNAREKFCHDVKSGEGRVYECLITNMNQELMDEECAKRLLQREKMMQKDVKVNYPLWKQCEADYKKYKCEDEHTDQAASEHGEASLLLMCLQKKLAEGHPLASGCQAEMRTFSIMIFEQYQVSPIIVAKCSKEIENHCSHLVGKEKDDGAMMDCLMTLASSGNDTMGQPCFSAVAEVLKETGAADNYKVDHALQVACESSIAALCDGKQDSMVLSCLMDNAHSQKMQPQCAEQVFHFQYFLSRDFRIDSALYRDCRNDAQNICQANKWGDDKESSMPDNFVISCLYRNSIIPKDNKKVSPKCSEHVRRVMHQRATDIRLMPEIESPCMADLGKLCAESTQEGEEIECLQNNYEDLSKKCKEAIKEFTVMEAKDFDLDKHLVEKCGSMVTKFCERELKDKDGEQILPCLISHKNDMEMDSTCTNALEHWQLIEMKDFEFSPKLKEICYEDVHKHCSQSKTKFEAVKCLSQKTVEDDKLVSAKCRQQIRKELAIQSENIQLNPELFHACKTDIETFCRDVPPGGAQIEECLRRNFPKLTNKLCKQKLMGQEELESKDVEIDYRLMHVCRPMIRKYCQPLVSEDPRDVLECLRGFTHDPEMTEQCKDIVLERQKEQAGSFNLDAELSTYCSADVKKHCSEEMKKASADFNAGIPDEGIVFGCLVDIVVDKKARLQAQCEKYVRKREREAALELELNPQFVKKCGDEIEFLCHGRDSENVIDCMKINIPKIKSKGCVEEVRKLIAEGVEDVHVDPFLEEQCARDINTYCKDQPKKSGNVVFCLIEVHKAKNLHLTPNCDNFMAKRIKLYTNSNVNLAAFDGVSAVMDAINVSPHRNYIYMTVLLFLSILFVGGILFGRFSKRIRQEIKNR